jgi:Domain of unknown function (DUF5615)
MWLLDANMDVHLVAILKDLGVSSATAASHGWKALSNGDLLAAAVSAGFECLLTRDQLFGESPSHAMKSYPQFAVVVITLPQQRWKLYRDSFLAAWTESPIRPIAGRMIHWP